MNLGEFNLKSDLKTHRQAQNLALNSCFLVCELCRHGNFMARTEG